MWLYLSSLSLNCVITYQISTSRKCIILLSFIRFDTFIILATFFLVIQNISPFSDLVTFLRIGFNFRRLILKVFTFSDLNWRCWLCPSRHKRISFLFQIFCTFLNTLLHLYSCCHCFLFRKSQFLFRFFCFLPSEYLRKTATTYWSFWRFLNWTI